MLIKSSCSGTHFSLMEEVQRKSLLRINDFSNWLICLIIHDNVFFYLWKTKNNLDFSLLGKPNMVFLFHKMKKKKRVLTIHNWKKICYPFNLSKTINIINLSTTFLITIYFFFQGIFIRIWNEAGNILWSN